MFSLQKEGQQVFSHSSYLSTELQQLLNEQKNKWNYQQRRNVVASALLATWAGTLNKQKFLPIFACVFIPACFLNQWYRDSQEQSFLRNHSQGLPYFTAEKKVVDLNRTFFFLDENKNFKPSLLYYGRVDDMPRPEGLL